MGLCLCMLVCTLQEYLSAVANWKYSEENNKLEELSCKVADKELNIQSDIDRGSLF